MKRSELLLGTRRTLAGPTRRKALLARTKLQPTRFQNRKGRTFYLTLKGSYVVLEYGRRVYGRKARFADGRPITRASRVPSRIRPKRV